MACGAVVGGGVVEWWSGGVVGGAVVGGAVVCGVQWWVVQWWVGRGPWCRGWCAARASSVGSDLLGGGGHCREQHVDCDCLFLVVAKHRTRLVLEPQHVRVARTCIRLGSGLGSGSGSGLVMYA
jgi:hypothetical protein